MSEKTETGVICITISLVSLMAAAAISGMEGLLLGLIITSSCWACFWLGGKK